MSRIIAVVLLALGLSLIALHGCKNEAAKWMGTWEGDLNRADPTMPNDDVKRAVNSIKLSIHPDGTFEMVRSGMPESGTHTLGTDKAFLKITKVLDRPIAQLGSGAEKMNLDLTATWQEDGSILLNDPGGFDGGPVRLTREQPSN